jgi:hypothetical protein
VNQEGGIGVLFREAGILVGEGGKRCRLSISIIANAGKSSWKSVTGSEQCYATRAEWCRLD